MKISLDPAVSLAHLVDPESFALAAWYDSRPAVRRLWGIKLARELQVIVSVEATLDNSDVLPVWLANRGSWANELRSCTRSAVKLDLYDDIVNDSIGIECEGVLIADLYWRDATLNLPNEVL